MTPLSPERLWEIFLNCFEPGEVWVRGSALGARFKKATGMSFKEYKPTLTARGLIVERGSAGLAEVALSSSLHD